MFLLSDYEPDDTDKLNVLYHKYAHTLWYMAMSYVKDEHMAEDIVHDAFLKIANYPERIGVADSHQTKYFLFTVVRHLSIDTIRRRQRWAEREHTEYMDLEANDLRSMPLERLIMGETLQDIRDALASLSDKYRIPLELKLINGCSNKEIAGLLGITPNLVGVQLIRARAMVIKYLKEETDGNGRKPGKGRSEI